MKQLLLCVLLGALAPLSLEADEAKGMLKEGIVAGRDTKGMSIELVSAVKSIKAGKPFKVGLKIKHDKRFHTYWKNSGVVGVPTRIKWKLPEGFTASEIHWPYPEKSMMADYPCFGYERDVLLGVEITPPKDVDIEKIELSAEVAWMCCASTCYPGVKQFKLILPHGEGEKDPKHEEVFRQSEAEVPVTTKNYTAKLLSKADSAKIEIRINTPAGVRLEYVFNSDGQTTPDLAYSLMKEEDGKWRLLVKRSKFGPQVKKVFPFILQSSEGYVKLSAE